MHEVRNFRELYRGKACLSAVYSSESLSVVQFAESQKLSADYIAERHVFPQSILRQGGLRFASTALNLEKNVKNMGYSGQFFDFPRIIREKNMNLFIDVHQRPVRCSFTKKTDTKKLLSL